MNNMTFKVEKQSLFEERLLGIVVYIIVVVQFYGSAFWMKSEHFC